MSGTNKLMPAAYMVPALERCEQAQRELWMGSDDKRFQRLGFPGKKISTNRWELWGKKEKEIFRKAGGL